MSYANGTQFYNLPQTVGTDKRDWFDTNGAFAAVDAALHAAVTGQAADAEAISTINTSLAAAESDIASLQTASTTQASEISALQATVASQGTAITDVRQDAEDMISAFNEGAASVSTHAYAIGDYFIYNDVLYKATAAIAIGDTIVPNTNCSATNVSSEIKVINADIDDVKSDLGGKIVATFNPISGETLNNMFHRIADFLVTLPYEKIPKVKLIQQQDSGDFGTHAFNVLSIGRSNPSVGYFSFDAVEYGITLINVDLRITGSSETQVYNSLVYDGSTSTWSVVAQDVTAVNTVTYYVVV